MSFTEHAPHPPQSPMWGCAKGETHLPKQHQGYMFGILIVMFDYFILFCPWGFRSQDNYLPRDRKDYKSYHSMIDPTAIVLIQIYAKSERGLS